MTTNSKHTPGPWTVGPWITSIGHNVYCVVSAPGRRISSVCVYGKRPDGTVGGRRLKNGDLQRTFGTDECDANARLIAAAPLLPEMAEALRMAQKQLSAVADLLATYPRPSNDAHGRTLLDSMEIAKSGAQAARAVLAKWEAQT